MISPEQQVRNSCWFSKLPGAGDCEGPRVVRCHLIPQQKMRQECPHGMVRGWRDVAGGEPRACWIRATREIARSPAGYMLRSLEALQSDPRGWVWGCGGSSGLGGHHARLDTAAHDSSKLVIPRALIPEETEEFADELQLGWWMVETYGPLQ